MPTADASIRSMGNRKFRRSFRRGFLCLLLAGCSSSGLRDPLPDAAMDTSLAEDGSAGGAMDTSLAEDDGAGGGESDVGAATGDGAVTPDGAPSLCDGTDGLRLAVQVGGGGPAAPGTAMLAENGWRFLLVDGSCHAWILPDDNDLLLTVELSDQQAHALSSALRLNDWNGLSVAAGGCADAPGITYRFDQQHVEGPTCGLPSGSPLDALNRSFDAQLNELAAIAQPVAGEVRYIIIDDPQSSSGDSRQPVSWPLAIDADAIAADASAMNGSQQSYQPGTSRLATGADATALRAIRTTSKSGATGSGTVFDFTPIRAASGNRHALYIRDQVPFATAAGLISPNAF